MHHRCSCDIYFSTTYNFSVYSIKYKNLGRTHPGNGTAEEKGEYIPTNKYTESERKSLSNLSSIHPEKSVDTQEIFQPEKSLRKKNMVIWYRHSGMFTNLGEGMIAYNSMTP